MLLLFTGRSPLFSSVSTESVSILSQFRICTKLDRACDDDGGGGGGGGVAGGGGDDGGDGGGCNSSSDTVGIAFILLE